MGLAQIYFSFRSVQRIQPIFTFSGSRTGIGLSGDPGRGDRGSAGEVYARPISFSAENCYHKTNAVAVERDCIGR
jgi:hypothetical protein